MSLNWQERSKKRDWSKKNENGTDRNENDSKKGKKQFWEAKPFLRNEKMVLKSKTGSEKQKATVQQLKKVLRSMGMRGKKRKITKRRKSLKKPSNQTPSLISWRIGLSKHNKKKKQNEITKN